MNTIPFKVNKNIIQKIGGYSIASSENNYTKFDFQFSDDWNKVGIQVSATMFFDSDKIPDPVLLTMRNDNTGYCYLPSALKDEHGILKLGLTGAYVDDKNEKVVINTLLTSMPIGPGAFMTKYPANDIYLDMLARIASFDKSKQDRLICKNGITIDKDSNISVDDDYVITTGNIPKYVDPIKKEIEQLEKNKLNGMTIRCTDLSELLNYEPGIYLVLLNCAGFYESSQLEECEVLIDKYGITIYIVQAGLFYFITKEQMSNGEIPKKLNLNINEIDACLAKKADKIDVDNSIDEIKANLDTKENISNKIDTINFPSTTYYPSSKAVFDYVNSKLTQPLSDITDIQSRTTVLESKSTAFNVRITDMEAGKENASYKKNAVDGSTVFYPSNLAVKNYVTNELNGPNAEIEILKYNKLDKTDFNTYKTATDKAVTNNAKSIKANTIAIDKCSTDIASNLILINKNAIKVTTEKSTGVVLNDSSERNINSLVMFGDSVQDGTPSPNEPVSIININNLHIKLYKKNLFDFSVCKVNTNDSATINSFDRDNCKIDFTTDESKVSSGIYLTHVDLNVFTKGYGVDYTKLGGKPVALSFDVQSDINCRIGVQFTKYIYNYFDITSEKQRIVVTDTVDINKLNKALCFYTNKTKANITISNIQIEVNNTATDYEDCEYQECATEHEFELRGVNNVTDTLTVNSDGTGYITQNLFYERLTSGNSKSNQPWKYSTTSERFYRDDNRIKANFNVPNLLCSHFPVKDNERDKSLDNTIGFTSGSGRGVAIRMSRLNGDISAFENWLDENEVYVIAPLKTSVITELSKEQVDKILSLYTYYQNTTIISGCDCQVKYVADTKNYIDNKILEVATALVASESEVM